MKKLISMIMAMSMISALSVACGDDDADDNTPPPAAPTITLEGGNIDQPQEITSTMALKVNIAAPGAIAGFTVTIDSPALTEEMLATVGLAKELDLVNPGDMEGALQSFGFPVGDEVKGKTSVPFDVSQLVPLIAQIYTETSDHKFILKVTDAKGQSTTKTLTCHLTEGPAIVLEDGDIDQPQEIVSEMSLKVSISAPASISGFTVTIDSPALTEDVLTEFGLAKDLDLVNPGNMAGSLEELGFPVGDGVKDKTSLSFDISQLVPLIALIYHETSDHKFILKVTDANAKTTTKTLTCHLTAKTTIAYNNDADLWANTATVSVEALPEGGSVQYRVKGATNWTDAELVEGSKYSLAPVWTAAKNDAEVDIYSIQAGTGVFAATTYEVRVVKDGETVDTTEFTTAAGDKIPNGDMSGWSTINRAGIGSTADVAYPNAEGAEAFWDCGNNGITKTLCTSTEEKAGASVPAAKMASMNMFVLAAGNLFTGSFSYANMTGTVDFGRKYAWTARPSALKLKYTATVGNIDVVRSTGDVVEGVAKNDPDNARIFVAIVDWTKPHQVVSAMTTTSGAWDPVKGPDVVTEGKIIGYGSLMIPASESDAADAALKDTELQIYWYDKTAKPAEGNYSLVISCACNAYGDFFTGCSKNTMYVDDFEWVY